MAGSEQLTIPSISVIVPCYNQGEYLAEALDSVLAQTYQNWECIIVNDGSNDNTEDIATEYCKKDNRFHYLTKENGGLSSARNAGIQQSKGEFILPLDADDLIAPQYIEKALEVFEDKNGLNNIDLVYSKAKFFGTKSDIWKLRPYDYTELLKSNMIFCSSIFKRFSYDKTGGYDNELKTGYEDWDLYIRILNNKSKVHQIDDYLFYYRIKAQSMLLSIDEKKQQTLNNYLYKKHHSIYLAYFDSPINMLRQIDLYENLYKNSPDYKLGSLILAPLRALLKKAKSIAK